jgi:hypothetical protein
VPESHNVLSTVLDESAIRWTGSVLAKTSTEKAATFAYILLRHTKGSVIHLGLGETFVESESDMTLTKSRFCAGLLFTSMAATGKNERV